MACTLTSGRLNACFDSVAGIKNVYFADNGTLGTVSYDLTDTDAIATLAGTPVFFKFNLRGTANNLVETITKSVDSGTSFIQQTLTFQLGKLSKEMNLNIKELIYGTPHVIVEDYNGLYRLCGLENGCDLTSGSIETGGAKGDFSGYKMVFTAEEKVPANFLVSDIPTTTATISATVEAP